MSFVSFVLIQRRYTESKTTLAVTRQPLRSSRGTYANEHAFSTPACGCRRWPLDRQHRARRRPFGGAHPDDARGQSLHLDRHSRRTARRFVDIPDRKSTRLNSSHTVISYAV